MSKVTSIERTPSCVKGSERTPEYFEIYVLKLSVLAHFEIIQLNSVMGLTSFERVKVFCRDVRSSIAITPIFTSLLENLRSFSYPAVI